MHFNDLLLAYFLLETCFASQPAGISSEIAYGTLYSRSFRYSLTIMHKKKYFIDFDNHTKKRTLNRLKVIKNALNWSVNVFSTKVVIAWGHYFYV